MIDALLPSISANSYRSGKIERRNNKKRQVRICKGKSRGNLGPLSSVLLRTIDLSPLAGSFGKLEINEKQV